MTTELCYLCGSAHGDLWTSRIGPRSATARPTWSFTVSLGTVVESSHFDVPDS